MGLAVSAEETIEMSASIFKRISLTGPSAAEHLYGCPLPPLLGCVKYEPDLEVFLVIFFIQLTDIIVHNAKNYELIDTTILSF